MWNSVNGRVFGSIVLALALAIVPGGWLMASETHTISAVEVQTQDGTTRVVLQGAEQAMYTAFMRQDPPRLIIDLPNVLFDGVETPIAVGDGVVTDITLGAFGDPRVSPTMARISIGLETATEYELTPEEGELVIALSGAGTPAVSSGSDLAALADGERADVQMRDEPAVEMREDSVVEMQEEAEIPAAPAESEETAPSPNPFEEPAEYEEAAQADEVTEAIAEADEVLKATVPDSPVSRIVSIVAAGDSVEVKADGPIDNVDSFVLESPDRIVVDFWGAKSAMWPTTQAIGQGPVAQVRVGEHADKVRVVLDLRAPALRHEVAPMAEGVRVAIQPASTVATPIEDVVENEVVPAAPDEAELEAEVELEVQPQEKVAEAAEPAPAPQAPAQAPAAMSSGSSVKSVHFESLPTADRIVVTLTQRSQANLSQPDGSTVIVDLPGVAIAATDERRVDTGEFGGPVEVFSAFRSPEIAGDNVRVVMKRRGSATPSMVWEGAQLRIELPRGDVAASAPPEAAPAAHEAPIPPAILAAARKAQAVAPTAAPASLPPADEDLFGGPADPASIDVLEEGGFARDKEYQGRRISLDFKDADIGNILRLIAEVSDLNVIAGEEVQGSVTIRMVDVPWDQALDVVLMTKGLGFLRIGNILRIAPIDVLQREEEARLQERRAKEKLEDLVVKLQPVNYANVFEVSELVKRLLSPRGTVNVDGRTSTLIIKDIPTVIQEATALVKAIDTATPQVLIEAKIVEASLDFSRALGARWGIGYNSLGSNAGGEDLHLGDGTNTVVPGFGVGTQGSNFVVANPIAAAVGTLTLGLLGLDDHLQLDLQLQAAETKNKGKVISSPRVVTLDNREAIIQQGVAIAFTAEDGDSINTSFVDAVLELKVRPHITADKSIIMDIKVSRNAPQLSDATGTVVGIAKNETKTEALVRDGQTMVLGGIYTVDKSKNRDKMPFLADIPVIGVAFRNHTQIDIRRELLVFVTPRIVQGLPAGS